MARGHGRSHFKDQFLVTTVPTATRQAIAKGGDDGNAAIYLEIFEKFPQASESTRFNKSFLLATPVT